MSAKEEFIETYKANIHREGAEALLDYLDGARWHTEVTPDLFDNLVERITVVSADEVRFHLLNGLELAERLV